MTIWWLWLRRLREDRAPAAVLGTLVLVTAFVFAIAPRLLDRLADDALRREIGDASAFARNIQLIQERPFGSGGAADPLAPALAAGDVLAGELPPEVAALVDGRAIVVDSPRWAVGVTRSADTFARLRIQPGAEDRIRYVAGGPPSGTTSVVSRPATQPATGEIQVSQLEGAVSAAAARQLGASAGDVVDLRLDRTDALAVGGDDSTRVALRITGIFDVVGPDDPWWLDDRSLERVSVRSLSPQVQFFDTTVLLSTAAYPALIDLTRGANLTLRSTWRYYLDPGRLEAGRADLLEADLKRLANRFPVSELRSYTGGDTAMRTGLLGLVEAQRARWRTAETVLTVVAVGPAVVAAVALALVTLLAGRRSRLALAIWRARGASRLQVSAAAIVEALVLTLPVVVLAVVAAIALVPAAPNVPTIAAAGAVLVATTAFLVAPAVPSTDAGTGRETPVVPVRRGRGRLVVEGIVVVLALAGAWLLRERGVTGASSAARLSGVDPLVAAVPALVGLAAGVVAVRLYPLPMRLAGALAAAGRGLVPALATRRAVHGTSARAVLVVLLATATIGAFSSAVLATLDRSADAVGWQEVGADFRVRPADDRFPVGFDPARIAPVEAIAGASTSQGTIVGRGERLTVLALDVAAYTRVVAGTPAAVDMPSAMLEPSADPVPAIVPASLGTRFGGYRVGDRLEITAAGYRVPLVVAALGDRFASVGPGQPTIVVSRDHLAAISPSPPPLAILYVRAPASAVDALRSAASIAAPGSTVDDRAALSAAIREQPSAVAVVSGVALAALVAAVFAAVAVTASLGLAGAAHALETAHLRTLGLTRRQAVGLVVVEHLPIVVLGFVAGATLGIGLFALLRDGLRLDAVVGSSVVVPLAIEPGALALVFGTVAAIAALGIGLGAILQGRAVTAIAVRRGIE